MARLAPGLKALAGVASAPLVFLSGLSIIAAVMVTLELRQLFRHEQEVWRDVGHTLEVLNATSGVETDLATVTAEARAFFANRDETAIAAVDAGAARVFHDVDVLRTLTSDNPAQQDTIRDLARRVGDRVATLRARIAELRAPEQIAGAQAPAGRPTTAGGVPVGVRALLRRIADDIERTKSREDDLLVQRRAAATRAAHQGLAFIAVSGTLLIAAIVGAFSLAIGQQRARDAEHLSEMRLLNADLERRVRERTSQLATSEARQKIYVDHLADGLVAVRVEPDGRFIYEEVNAAARVMLEFPEECIGRAVEDVWPRERAQLANANFRQCVEARRPIRNALTSPTRSGPRELRFILAPVIEPVGAPEPDGPVVLLLASLRDVTYELQLEAQLTQGQRIEVIGQLAAGVAHDLNNLLQAQMGSLELLEDAIGAGDSAAAGRYIATALRMGDRGARLTNHLLSFSRKQILHPRAVGVAEFLSRTVEGLASSLGPAILLSVSVDLDTGAAMVDPGLLETALLNLAFNARDAMPKGGRLRIEAFSALTSASQAAGSGAALQAGVKTALLNLAFNTRDAMPEGGRLRIEAMPANAASAVGLEGSNANLRPGPYVVIVVSDDGAGMAPETLARAIEPFFTTKGVKGSGLGLAMVQGFILQSRGDMRIVSELGHGTRIEVWLPACAAAETEVSVDALAPHHPGRRALVVDDVADVLVTVGAFLEHAGFAVIKASSGEAALAVIARDRRFDILISDYAMPGISGPELIARARELCPDLAVLLITGNAEQATAQQLDRVQVLAKPFRREGLLLAVNEVLPPEAAGQVAATPVS